MVVEPVDKCPSSYEPYQFTLSERYRQIAKEELGEDDTIRDRSLAQLREWIAKHPYIRKCRTDALFLLRFLRFQKFSIPKAQQSIERYLVTRQRLPQWYQSLDPQESMMRKITNDRVISVLGKDGDGRTVILARLGRFDVDHLTAQHLFRYFYMLVEYLFDHDESVQIAGLRVWIDQSGTTMKYFGLWGMTEIKVAMEAFARVVPFRFREAILAELPSTAIALVNLGLSMMSSELKNAISFYPTISETKKHFEENLWIKEYGGTLDMEILCQELAKNLDDARDQLLGLDQMEIDIEHYSKTWSLDAKGDIGEGMIGSFRSLDID